MIAVQLITAERKKRRSKRAHKHTSTNISNAMINLDLMMCAALGRRLLCKLKKMPILFELICNVANVFQFDAMQWNFSHLVSAQNEIQCTEKSETARCCGIMLYKMNYHKNRLVLIEEEFHIWITKRHVEMIKYLMLETLYIAILLTERILPKSKEEDGSTFWARKLYDN